MRSPKFSRRPMLIGTACSLSFALRANHLSAQLEVDIDQSKAEPLPIAVSEFAVASGASEQLAEQITDIVGADLERSGLFEIVNPRAYLQRSADMNPFPNFADWRLINAQALVSGIVRLGDRGEIIAEYRLWDVFSEEQLRAQRLQASRSSLRRIAHKIADGVYERITGEDSYFDTRIVFVDETGPQTDRIKNLAIIDQDGFGQRSLTAGNNLYLSPNVSPDGKFVAYIAFHRGGLPRIIMRDLNSGQERPLLEQAKGMTFSPRFAPDGESMLFSIAQDGNTEIYSLSLQSRRSQRLSRHPAIDTSPSFAPDGSQVAFNSDRGGSPQLYLMLPDGSNVRRISFGTGQYGSPAWSPRGDFIAFTKIKDSFFHIGVMRPDGSDERLITRSFFDEQPSWAPNGRTIVFTRQDPLTDHSVLYMIDLTGYNLRELKTTHDASDADWVPLIP